MAKSRKKSQKSNNRKVVVQQSKPKIVYVDKPTPSIGAQIGDKLQKLGESLFTRFMGTGDYTCNDGAYGVKTNALIKGSDAKAVKMNSGKSSFIFEHTEYIGDVYAGVGGAFNQQEYTVNPINPVTFPWLSNIAPSFESYEVQGMIFRYVSSSGQSVASTNTSIGTIMGVFAYDTLDASFVSKQQLLQYEDVVNCRTSENFICGVECDPTRLPTFSNKLYVGAPPSGSDPKLYNYGKFVVASQGTTADNQILGEVWVSYRIKFHMTKDTNYVPGSAHLVVSGVGAPSQSLVTLSQGSFPMKLVGSATTFSAAQVGSYYMITFSISSTASGTWTFSTPSDSSFTFVNLFGNGVRYFAGNGNATFTATPTAVTVSYTIKALKDVVTFPFPYSSVPNTPNGFDIIVNQLDSTLQIV
jgi:hypothetical protein